MPSFYYVFYIYLNVGTRRAVSTQKLYFNFCEWDVWEAVPYGKVCFPYNYGLIGKV